MRLIKVNWLIPIDKMKFVFDINNFVCDEMKLFTWNVELKMIKVNC